MNFCNQCGHTVALRRPESDNRLRYVCGSCETIHYENPKIVAGCLPLWEDKILLCRRSIDPRRGFWNLPSGFMENGESVEVGAAREVLEEAMIEVNVTSLHSIYSLPHYHQVYIHFLAELPDLSFAPGEESLECRLFTEAEIPWEELAFSSSVFSLQRLFADRKAGLRQVHLGEDKR